MTNFFQKKIIIILFLCMMPLYLFAQSKNSEGPYKKLIIRGVTLLDGTGAPPKGPVDIVIENDMIVDIENFGYSPFTDNLKDDHLLKGADKIIDARGMYATPGFINLHTHPGPNLEYDYLLHLSHGVTTIRSLVFDGDGIEQMLQQRSLSDKNSIVAPRIRLCAAVGAGTTGRAKVYSPEAAREWVRFAKEKGIDCIGESGPTDPDIMKAYLDEANKLGIPTMIHIGFNTTTTAKDAAEWGLDEMEHFYQLFLSILKDNTIRDYPYFYNENYEDHRYPLIGWIHDQSFDRGSKEWDDLINFFKERNFILNPTMIIYQFVYDYMKARNADWMAEYAMPDLWKSFEPDPLLHAGAMGKLTSVDEAKWQQYLGKWMRFLKDYTQAGGRVTVATDANSVYQLEGFSYISEMILLQQAGLISLEVLRAATLYGAEAIFQPYKSTGKPIEFGVLKPGTKADILLMKENPLEDFKPLYGTGAVRLNDKGEITRVRSLKYTIKNGVIYDSQELLDEIKRMVNQEKLKTGQDVELPAMYYNVGWN